MRRFLQTAALFTLLAMMTLNCAVAAPTATVSSADPELTAKSAQFKKFAVSKVKQLNRNHILSRERMQVTRQADGSYRGLYHQIDEASMAVKVRRSSSKSIPFVGIISYQEHVFRAEAPSPKQLAKDKFDLIQIIPNKHLFSYRQGTWQ